MTCISCDFGRVVFIYLKLNTMESPEENLNGKVWQAEGTSNELLLWCCNFRAKNKSRIFWDWFAQISDLRKSLGSHFSWVKRGFDSLSLYRNSWTGRILQRNGEKIFRPNQIFCFSPNYFQMQEKANHTEELHTAMKLECKSSSKEGTNFE